MREAKSLDDLAVLTWTNSIDYSGLAKSYKNSREHVYVNCFVVFQVFVILVFWTVPCFFLNIDNWHLSLKEKISKSSNVSFIICNPYETNLETCRFFKKGGETSEFSTWFLTCLIHDIYMYVIMLIVMYDCEEMKRKLSIEYLYKYERMIYSLNVSLDGWFYFRFLCCVCYLLHVLFFCYLQVYFPIQDLLQS